MLRRKFLAVLGALPFLTWLRPSPPSTPECCSCGVDTTVVPEHWAESWRYDTDPLFRRRVTELTNKLHNQLYDKTDRGDDTHELNLMWQWCRDQILHGSAGLIAYADGQCSLVDPVFYEQLCDNDYVAQLPQGTNVEYVSYVAFDERAEAPAYVYFRPTADDPDEKHLTAMWSVVVMARMFATENRHTLPHLAAVTDRAGRGPRPENAFWHRITVFTV